MSATEWLVVLGGGAAIVWVNWYFFFAEHESERATLGAGGIHEVAVIVHGGYEPAEVRVKRGVPVRLVFDRREANGCSEEVVFPDFGVRRFLAAHRKTVVEITPERAGTYEFTCGMGMLRGQLTVEESEEV